MLHMCALVSQLLVMHENRKSINQLLLISHAPIYPMIHYSDAFKDRTEIGLCRNQKLNLSNKRKIIGHLSTRYTLLCWLNLARDCKLCAWRSWARVVSWRTWLAWTSILLNVFFMVPSASWTDALESAWTATMQYPLDGHCHQIYGCRGDWYCLKKFLPKLHRLLMKFTRLKKDKVFISCSAGWAYIHSRYLVLPAGSLIALSPFCKCTYHSTFSMCYTRRPNNNAVNVFGSTGPVCIQIHAAPNSFGVLRVVTSEILYGDRWTLCCMCLIMGLFGSNQLKFIVS
jgi:hypothetical protein